jgi:hypothetical protein
MNNQYQSPHLIITNNDIIEEMEGRQREGREAREEHITSINRMDE